MANYWYSGKIVISQSQRDKLISGRYTSPLNVVCKIDFNVAQTFPNSAEDASEGQTEKVERDIEFTVTLEEILPLRNSKTGASEELIDYAHPIQPQTTEHDTVERNIYQPMISESRKDQKEQANDKLTRYDAFYTSHSEYFETVDSMDESVKCLTCTKQCDQDPTKCINPWKEMLEKGEYAVLVHPKLPKPLSTFKWMVVYSKNKERTGVISTEYTQYSEGDKLGNGGFGRVYELKRSTGPKSLLKTLAVKEENLEPLIYKPKRLEIVLGLEHTNVVQAEEYIVGDKVGVNKRHTFLFVMPIMEHKGLNEPFVEAKHGNTAETKRGYECLLDYMKSSKMKIPFYLRNFLAVSKQIFNALTYFEENKFVHRDIKRSNILMEKFAHCPCEHPILCCCKSEGTILCKIADFDLMDKAIATDSKFKTLNPSPGGSKGMIAPEVFFKDKEGKKIFSPKSDVWSTCITLMHVLVGKYRNNDTLTQLITFFNKVNIELPEIINKCATSIEQMKKIQSNPSLECALQIDCEQIIKTFDELKTSLENMKKFQMQNDTNVKQNIHGRKQGDAIYCPIAEILASVYGVQILPYVCQEELSGHFNAGSCFNTILKELCRIIQMGIRFQSDQRLKASDIMQKLQDLEVNVDIGNELMRREE